MKNRKPVKKKSNNGSCKKFLYFYASFIEQALFTFSGIIVLAVIGFILLSLYFNWIGAGFTFTIAIAILGIFEILTPSEILNGFANEQIAVIVMLLLLGDIIRRNGILDGLFDRAFSNILNYRKFMGRMLFIVAGFSAFLNNTPLVAIMMPYVGKWSKKAGIAPSKVLIPLSYAAILGGCATLIGTSTNLVVNGMVTDQKIVPGLEPLNIFDFSFVGIPMILIGIGFMVLFGNRLLPNRKPAIDSLVSGNREYIAEVRLTTDSSILGKTVEEAGLHKLKGLTLEKIIRGAEEVTPMTFQTTLMKEDILLFFGEPDTIAEMIETRNGLQLAQVGMFAKKLHTEIVEVVVSYNSTLITRTTRMVNFRVRFDAALIAIHRNGERLSGKVEDVRLMAGDVMLLITGNDFASLAQDTQDFYLINRVRELQKQPFYKKLLLIGGTLAVILASAIGIMKLFTGLIGLIILCAILRIIPAKEIAKSIDFNLIIIIALALALGTAMIKTGVAGVVADLAFNLLKPLGIVGILAGIFLITNILAAFITNKAAVALVFPIAITMAIHLGFNPKPFILIVAFAGAASFLTPIGYQTNLMVYGPGGYVFRDFFRIGLPITLLYLVVAVLGLVWQYGIRLYD